MVSLSFTVAADQQLGKLEGDQKRTQLLKSVNEVLDALEQDPGDARLRRKEFRQLLEWPLCYAVEIRGSNEEWVILWTWNPDSLEEPVVIYIGPPPGG